MSRNRLNDLLTVTNVGLDWMTKAQSAEAKLADLTALHPAAEWTEADGAVLWWPHDGRPFPLAAVKQVAVDETWDGYYTHWSRIPKVQLPAQPKEAK